MKKFENWLLSKPYVLNVLYFGSLGWILYSFCKQYLDKEIEIFGYQFDSPDSGDILFFMWFVYLTHLAGKKARLNKMKKSK